MAAKRQAGELIGEVPFGWTLGTDGLLVEDAAEQKVLNKIMDCHRAGMSLRAIAAILTEAKVPTKKGRTSWNHNTVRSILNRASLAA